MSKVGCIYKITNTINGKSYIGKTVQVPERRWYLHKYYARHNHGGALYNAIRKYGEDTFTFEVLDRDILESELGAKEVEYIITFNTCVMDGLGHGYNMTRGGDGGDSELSYKLQMEKVENGLHHFQGEQGRGLQLKRIAEGTHNFTPENRSKYQKGKKLSQEAKNKVSAFNKERVANGTHPWTAEHTRRLIESGMHSSCKIHVCPHCGKEGKGGGMKRWHFENCKQKEKLGEFSN